MWEQVHTKPNLRVIFDRLLLYRTDHVWRFYNYDSHCTHTYIYSFSKLILCNEWCTIKPWCRLTHIIRPTSASDDRRPMHTRMTEPWDGGGKKPLRGTGRGTKSLRDYQLVFVHSLCDLRIMNQSPSRWKANVQNRKPLLFRTYE